MNSILNQHILKDKFAKEASINHVDMERGSRFSQMYIFLHMYFVKLSANGEVTNVKKKLSTWFIDGPQVLIFRFVNNRINV